MVGDPIGFAFYQAASKFCLKLIKLAIILFIVYGTT